MIFSYKSCSCRIFRIDLVPTNRYVESDLYDSSMSCEECYNTALQILEIGPVFLVEELLPSFLCLVDRDATIFLPLTWKNRQIWFKLVLLQDLSPVFYSNGSQLIRQGQNLITRIQVYTFWRLLSCTNEQIWWDCQLDVLLISPQISRFNSNKNVFTLTKILFIL